MFNALTIMIVGHRASKFREKLSKFKLKGLLKAFCHFGSAMSASANSVINSSSLFQLTHLETLYLHTCMHTCMHTCVHICMNSFIHVCIHTYIYVDTRTLE